MSILGAGLISGSFFCYLQSIMTLEEKVKNSMDVFVEAAN
jgi:hypothetical protein